MSWDLYLLPTEHVQAVDEWLEEAAEEGHDSGEALRHADAVRARRPELELGGPYGAGYQLTLPEDSQLPLDIGLYGNHASISVAYWGLGSRANDLAEIVVEVVEALSAATGWVPYDPQEGRVVGADELRGVVVRGHEQGVGFVDEITQRDLEQKRKRRFGLF